MKTTFLIALGFLFSACLYAQDSLYTTDGNVIGAKIVEINQDEVKYRKSSNPDGPLYVISRSEVALIEYRNGSKDIFAQPADDQEADGLRQAVVIHPRPAVNVVVNALPALAWTALSWGWGWGWCRPAGIYSHRHHYWHHGHHGHYGRRGGRR